MIWQSGKTLCEGRALTVAKAALPSRTPPGHAKQEILFTFVYKKIQFTKKYF